MLRAIQRYPDDARAGREPCVAGLAAVAGIKRIFPNRGAAGPMPAGLARHFVGGVMIGVAIFPGGNQPSARAGGAGHGAQASHGPRAMIAQLKIGNGSEVQAHR